MATERTLCARKRAYRNGSGHTGGRKIKNYLTENGVKLDNVLTKRELIYALDTLGRDEQYNFRSILSRRITGTQT